ncbi:hypothetical protein ACHAPO_006569 [Fusarium lateritium]
MLLTVRQALAHANEEYAEAYNAGPYTSYKQIQLLLKTAGKSIGDLIADPKGTFEDLTYDTILDVCKAGGPDVEATWNGDSGRCTATSLRVAERLVLKYPGGNYDFEIFHAPRGMGGHRFARCTFTGIVIDVVSNIGAFVLPDDETVTITTTGTVSWRHDKGKIYLIEEDGDEQKCEKVSNAQAQANCLYEVSRKAQLVLLFRELDLHLVNQKISGNKYKHAMFAYGVIKWYLKPDRVEDDVTVAGIKELHLRPDTDNPDDMTVIVWDQSHTAKDKKEAVNEVKRFLADQAGPFADRQWEADDVNDFFDSIWWELCQTYGDPKVTKLAVAD